MSTSPSMRGLSRAIGVQPDYEDDPLGVGVQSRAADARWRALLTHQGPMQGPLPDPKWEGYFQALKEHGVDRLIGGPSQDENELAEQTGRFRPLPNQPIGATSFNGQSLTRGRRGVY